jgi:hypothetical protein
MSCIKLLVSFCVLSVAAQAVNPVAPSVTIDSTVAAPGALVRTVVASPEAPLAGERRLVIFGTGRGQTTLVVAGNAVVVPFANAWIAGEAATQVGRIAFSAPLPGDPSLVGQELGAVLLSLRADGSFFVSARTGGPIIQDALS